MLVHVVFIPVKMCRDLVPHSPSTHTLPMRTSSSSLQNEENLLERRGQQLTGDLTPWPHA